MVDIFTEKQLQYHPIWRRMNVISCNDILFEGSKLSEQHWSQESHGQYISAIYRHMQILISSELAPYRIGSGQYIFLMAIAFQQPITQKALSEKLLIDKTTTAKAIAKLEAEGYVRRRPIRMTTAISCSF